MKEHGGGPVRAPGAAGGLNDDVEGPVDSELHMKLGGVELGDDHAPDAPDHVRRVPGSPEPPD